MYGIYGWGKSLLASETVLQICLQITFVSVYVCVCASGCLCESVCVFVSLHVWSWMATPDSERNAGFIPVYQPLLALSA